jgi:hypothetical protein
MNFILPIDPAQRLDTLFGLSTLSGTHEETGRPNSFDVLIAEQRNAELWPQSPASAYALIYKRSPPLIDREQDYPGHADRLAAQYWAAAVLAQGADRELVMRNVLAAFEARYGHEPHPFLIASVITGRASCHQLAPVLRAIRYEATSQYHAEDPHRRCPFADDSFRF